MAKTLRTTLIAIESFLDAHGGIDQATIGEPYKPPLDGYTAAVMNVRTRSEVMTLSKTIEIRTVMVRIYHKLDLGDPNREIELTMSELVDELVEDFLGDFDFDGTIRNINPVDIQVDWGNQTIDHISFRLVDILIPMTVDDSATFTK